jgi:riboflavin biosynthesis pyrimidine reductase
MIRTARAARSRRSCRRRRPHRPLSTGRSTGPTRPWKADAVEVIARLKEESTVPLRSHGGLPMNRALLAAGLVDRVQVTLFPVITGRTGLDRIFEGAADFDLQLLESRTLDGRIQELVYRPSPHP